MKRLKKRKGKKSHYKENEHHIKFYLRCCITHFLFFTVFFFIFIKSFFFLLSHYFCFYDCFVLFCFVFKLSMLYKHKNVKMKCEVKKLFLHTSDRRQVTLILILFFCSSSSKNNSSLVHPLSNEKKKKINPCFISTLLFCCTTFSFSSYQKITLVHFQWNFIPLFTELRW